MKKPSNSSKPRATSRAVASRSAMPRKGASRSGQPASNMAASAWLRWLLHFIRRAVFVGILVVSGFAVFKAMPYVNPAIENVAVEGTIERLDQAILSQAIYENLRGGILTLDIDYLRSEVTQIPWVESVQIIKHFPSTLVVRVEEEQAIARWNEQGYISHKGEFIESQLYEDLVNLPQLGSSLTGLKPEIGARQAIEIFHRLNSSVLTYEQNIRQLNQSVAGGWTMVWDNGLSIDLGRVDHLNRIRHALAAWQRLPLDVKEKIDRIDARYNNGVAIGSRVLDASDVSGVQTEGLNQQSMNIEGQTKPAHENIEGQTAENQAAIKSQTTENQTVAHGLS